MQATARRILELVDDPEALESLYRQHPQSFRDALGEAALAAPDALTLRAWRARLTPGDTEARWDPRRLVRAVGIGLVVGALVRVPALWLGEEWYYPRLGPSLVLLSLAAWFWFEHRERRTLVAGLGLAGVAVAWTAFLPNLTDSVVMALVHLPILFWGVVALAFTGAGWREPSGRIRFVRYNGELLILATLVALGGFVFSGITVSLFSLILPDPAEWYAENIGVVGAAAVPVAATYMYDVVFRRHTGIASVLARIFAPLFLVMAVIYLVVAFAGGQNPFFDRSFLITVNGLLLVVLGMTVFSIAERPEGQAVGWGDRVTVALLLVTLVIDLIALSAIVFRLASYGFTPNRVVVLGANVVVLAHLAWICRGYVGLLRGTGSATEVRDAVAGYLPVYIGWAVLVTFVLPLVFRFT